MLRALAASTAILMLGACGSMDHAAPANPVDVAALQKKAVLAGETNQLNHLTRIAIDARDEYAGASALAEDDALKAELARLAADHGAFAKTLQSHVVQLGGEPANAGEDENLTHRSFLALGDLIEEDSLAAAGELHRGESYLLDELGKSLESAALSAASKQLIEAEVADVTAGRDRVAAIESRLISEIDASQLREDEAAKAQRELERRRQAQEIPG
jgi:uncharacterized protein (TIGR02284 family)